MKTIWKYALPVKDEFTIEMPLNAKILAIQSQNEIGHMWALVESNAPMEMRTFVTIGTGHKVEATIDTHQYRGTYRQVPFVWHIFEKN